MSTRAQPMQTPSCRRPSLSTILSEATLSTRRSSSRVALNATLRPAVAHESHVRHTSHVSDTVKSSGMPASCCVSRLLTLLPSNLAVLISPERSPASSSGRVEALPK
jgi:hypothetical protein